MGSSWTARSKLLRTISADNITLNSESQFCAENNNDSHNNNDMPGVNGFITDSQPPVDEAEPDSTDMLSPVLDFIGLNRADNFEDIYENEESDEEPGVDESEKDAIQTIVHELGNVHSTIIKSFRHITFEVLVAILTLYGKCYYSTQQYEHLKSVMGIFECQKSLPSLSSIRKVKWPHFCSILFPKSITIQCSSLIRHINPFSTIHDTSTPQVNDSIDAESNQQLPNSIQKKSLIVIPLSEWARYDISNIAVQRAMIQPKFAFIDDGVSFITERRIEQASILYKSTEVSSEPDSLFIKSDE